MRRHKLCFFMAGTYPVFAKMNHGFGGAEINLYYISRGLAKDDRFEVKFVVGDYGQKNGLVIDNVKLVKIKYLNAERFPSYYHKILARILFCLFVLKDRSDVYVCSTASDFFAFIAFFARMLRKKKAIFRTAHDWDVNGHFTKSRSLLGILHKFAIHRVDTIITQNEDQKITLKKVENLESVVIKNGFPIPDEDSLPREKEYFLWIGRSDNFKRPELFVRLARSLPSHQFTMILAGNNEQKVKVLKEASNVPNLIVHDGQSFFQSLSYFEHAQCLVNTSSSEGFPNTFIQAGLTKTPILSFVVNPEGILEQYDMGYCCDNDLEKAKSFLTSLSKVKIDQIGANALAYVRKHHNLEDKIKQYRLIIDRVSS